jgi:aminoglycoside phosphotransferase (APT) family kinase protein
MVRCLIEAQAPQWANLPLRRIASSGTDNAIFRLGEALAVRIPRRASSVPLLSRELEWLPRLRDLPLDVPAVRFRGWSDQGFAFGVVDWIEGRIATPDRIANPRHAALQLADFLDALHRIDTDGAPRAGAANNMRGAPLRELSERTLPTIAALADEIDTRRARDLWDTACAQDFRDPPVWLHGDLKADNLIARGGDLRGVIDWGLSAVGDPAADYAAAWAWIDATARHLFRERLHLDDATWCRARGWALYSAVIALSHWRGRGQQALCRQSRLTLSRLGLLL